MGCCYSVRSIDTHIILVYPLSSISAEESWRNAISKTPSHQLELTFRSFCHFHESNDGQKFLRTATLISGGWFLQAVINIHLSLQHADKAKHFTCVRGAALLT
jgi:hypothetical protein